MKILAVITVVLILVLAWTQNRTIQKSSATDSPDQALIESAGPQSGQERQAGAAVRPQDPNPSRDAAVPAGSAWAYSASSAQKSAQARQQQAQSNQVMASRNAPSGAAYGEQYQARSQQRANEQRAAQQRQAQSQRYNQQRASERQHQSRSEDYPSQDLAYSGARPQRGDIDRPQGSSHEYDNIDSTPYRTASRSYLQADGSRGSGDYGQSTHQQATSRPTRDPARGAQSSTYPGRHEAPEQPEANESKYQQVSEPVDCIYRDDKVYCR